LRELSFFQKTRVKREVCGLWEIRSVGQRLVERGTNRRQEKKEREKKKKNNNNNNLC